MLERRKSQFTFIIYLQKKIEFHKFTVGINITIDSNAMEIIQKRLKAVIKASAGATSYLAYSTFRKDNI